MNTYEIFWRAAIETLFNGWVDRGLAYGFLIFGLFLMIRKERIAAGSVVMIISFSIAFGSTIFNVI